MLALILATLDTSRLVAVFRRAEPLPLLLAYVVPLPAILLRVLRWRLLLGSHAANWRIRELLVIYCQSIAAGVVTPGRVGEFAKAAWVARRGTPLGAAMQSALVDRLADLSCLAVLALGALPLVATTGNEALGIVLAVGVVVAGSASLWVVTTSQRAEGLRRRLLATARRMLPGAPADLDGEDSGND